MTAKTPPRLSDVYEAVDLLTAKVDLKAFGYGVVTIKDPSDSMRSALLGHHQRILGKKGATELGGDQLQELKAHTLGTYIVHGVAGEADLEWPERDIGGAHFGAWKEALMELPGRVVDLLEGAVLAFQNDVAPRLDPDEVEVLERLLVYAREQDRPALYALLERTPEEEKAQEGNPPAA